MFSLPGAIVAPTRGTHGLPAGPDLHSYLTILQRQAPLPRHGGAHATVAEHASPGPPRPDLRILSKT